MSTTFSNKALSGKALNFIAKEVDKKLKAAGGMRTSEFESELAVKKTAMEATRKQQHEYQQLKNRLSGVQKREFSTSGNDGVNGGERDSDSLESACGGRRRGSRFTWGATRPVDFYSKFMYMVEPPTNLKFTCNPLEVAVRKINDGYGGGNVSGTSNSSREEFTKTETETIKDKSRISEVEKAINEAVDKLNPEIWPDWLDKLLKKGTLQEKDMPAEWGEDKPKFLQEIETALKGKPMNIEDLFIKERAKLDKAKLKRRDSFWL